MNIFSQTSDYRFKNFTIKEGLSQNTVTSIYQDRLGQMWFGTRNGLNSFDGNNFKVYRNDPLDSTSIGHNDITSIDKDSEGNMWIGTYRGLNKFDPITNTFTEYLHRSADGTIRYNTIRCLKEIDDEIWVGTSRGLSIFNKISKTFTSIIQSSTDPKSLSHSGVRKIMQTKNGTIWIGTDNGLNKLITRNKDQFTFKRFGVYQNERSWQVQDLKEDSKNNIWIGTKHHGLFKLNSKNDNLSSVSSLLKFKKVDKNIRALAFDSAENLWISTFSGISILHPDGSLNNLEINNQRDSHLGRGKSVFLDQKGSIWIGSYYGGVSVWDPSFNSFINLDKNNLDDALSYNVVSSIISDQKNNIYIGTTGGGVTIFNMKKGKTKFFDQNNMLGLAKADVKSLCWSTQNELWIGTLNQGVFVVDVPNKRLVKNRISTELQSLLAQKAIHAIHQENEQTIWIGTYGNGLIRYDLKNKEFRIFRKKLNNFNSKPNNRVRTILIDSSNKIWYGTQRGLNSFNLNELENEELDISQFFYDEQTNFGFEILTIFEDSKKNIWVGTYQNGFYLLQGDTFEKIDIKDDIQSVDLVSAILEDNMHNLWLSTNHGIVNFNRESRKSIIYDQTVSNITSEFSNSAYNFNNKKFFFGGETGVTYFDPENIALNKYAPKVIFTNFKVKNSIIEPNDNNAILEKSIAFTNKISLSYDKSNFSIGFAIPSFINAADNQYAYRLKGLDEEFIFSSNNEVNYIIQNPGTYIFEVKGANNDGVWNEDITSLEIVVEPAPWRSSIAFVAYAMLIILSLIGLINFLNSRTKLAHELELEHLENERIEELNNTKLQFFTNISHEFRTPLTLILAPLEQLLTDYKGSNMMYEKLLVVQNNAKHLFKLINRLMDFRKLENKQLSLKTNKGNIVEFLRIIYSSFTEYAKDGNYNYTFETNYEEILAYYDHPKLEQVFYNLISNAFRYTPKGGTIEIVLKKNEKDISIEIKDTGVGIAKEHLDKIFDRFFEIPIHNNPQANYNTGTGIGLSIANNIVKLHKGEIEVKNKKTKGAIFKVTLPLGKEHLLAEEIIDDFMVDDDLTQYQSQLTSPEILLNSDINDLNIDQDKATLLIVEDNTALRLFIRSLLHNDYNIIEAENGKIALEKALKHIPDLIISDIIMPEMEGTELCSKIKKDLRTSHIPVILLTSRNSLIYKYQGLESGADDYISKPFIIKEFKLKIKNHLEAAQRLRKKFSNENSFVPSDIVISSIDEELLKKAFKIVEDNIGNYQFDTSFFCRELAVSRTMLFTKIKAWTNFTPNEFVLEIRMKRAAQLLEQNKITISEICYSVGYQNPKYFRQIFRKKFGKSPSQYQKKFSTELS